MTPKKNSGPSHTGFDESDCVGGSPIRADRVGSGVDDILVRRGSSRNGATDDGGWLRSLSCGIYPCTTNHGAIRSDPDGRQEGSAWLVS